MTPEDLNNALQSAALTYVREVKQQDVPLRVNRKRLSNTPVRGTRFVLNFPDDRRTEGFSTQTTYTRRSSGVGGGIHEQRYAAERVLPQSAVELRHAES